MHIIKSVQTILEKINVDKILIEAIVRRKDFNCHWISFPKIQNMPIVHTAQRVQDGYSILVQWFQIKKEHIVFAVWKIHDTKIGAKELFLNFVKDYGVEFQFLGRKQHYIMQLAVPMYSSYHNGKYERTYEQPQFDNDNVFEVAVDMPIDIKRMYLIYYAIDLDRYAI